ncbi:hypothetical protein FisN_15Hu244 [Fistulifera solaris]|uniref:Uncharacterized protein n=1 Tax=Fistulifera solaris TaxID=1519565 RepID=A0A1Z5JFI6_FISSO|nr:hypothetical protein FisN_15Hu244 [Fistulifera solaris]|eukprot:GAX12765.1 hypothetical protein FisN_15Hu244 [Fistulifera solaris]
MEEDDPFFRPTKKKKYYFYRSPAYEMLLRNILAPIMEENDVDEDDDEDDESVVEVRVRKRSSFGNTGNVDPDRVNAETTKEMNRIVDPSVLNMKDRNGIYTVRNLTQDFFREKLVTHFTIARELDMIHWPRDKKSMTVLN